MKTNLKKFFAVTFILAVGTLGRVFAANNPPVVDAGENQTIIYGTTGSVLLSGNVTDDGLPFGLLVSSWTLISGPAMTFDNKDSAITIAHFSGAGTYVLKLSAFDGQVFSFDITTVTVVAAINQAPRVDAGLSQTISISSYAVLMGTVTDDGLPFGVLKSSWSKVSGPGSVTFGNSLSPVTTAHFSSTGTYILELSATDDSLFSLDFTTVTVTVPVNHAPVVNAGPDRTIVLSTSPYVLLLGSATDDGLPFGVIFSSWSKLSGPGEVAFFNSINENVLAQFSSTGTYVLVLNVNDGQLSGMDTVTIRVESNPGTPPVLGTSSSTTPSPSPLDRDNIIQLGSKTIVRGNEVNSAKIVFRAAQAGRVTIYVYERSLGMKIMYFDALAGDNDIFIRDIKNQLNLSWGVYHLTMVQNGTTLKKNIPLALVP